MLGCLTEEEECHEWQEQYNWDQEGQKRYEQLNKETWKKGGEITLTTCATDSSECSFCETDEEANQEGIQSPCSTVGDECSLYEDEGEPDGKEIQQKKWLWYAGTVPLGKNG